MDLGDNDVLDGSAPTLFEANQGSSNFEDLQFPLDIPDWSSLYPDVDGLMVDHPGNGSVHSNHQVIDLDNIPDHEIIDLDNYPSDLEEKVTIVKKEESDDSIPVPGRVNDTSSIKQGDDDVVYISTTVRPIQTIDLIDSDDEKGFPKGGPIFPRVKLENAGFDPQPIKKERAVTPNVNMSNVVHASRRDDDVNQTEQHTHSRGIVNEVSDGSQQCSPVSNIDMGRSILSARREHSSAPISTQNSFGVAEDYTRAQPPNAGANTGSGSTANQGSGSESFGQIIPDDDSEENRYVLTVGQETNLTYQ